MTVAGTSHGFGSANLLWTVYDNTGRSIDVDHVTVNASTFDFTVFFTNSQSGTLVLNGSGGSYYSTSFTGQTTVSLAHNFNRQIVKVACMDGSNNFVEPDRINFTTNTTATVTFTNPQTGTCAVN